VIFVSLHNGRIGNPSYEEVSAKLGLTVAMPRPLTQSDLEAYLDEQLVPEEMARIEGILRKHPEMAEQLAAINSRRDAGVHSLGEIWRRSRVSCPTREQLGSWLLGVLGDAHAQYVRFHLQAAGCRYCRANLEDLRTQQEEHVEVTTTRRRKYFQTSAGYLRPDR